MLKADIIQKKKEEGFPNLIESHTIYILPQNLSLEMFLGTPIIRGQNFILRTR